MQENFNILQLTGDFKYWLEQRIHDWYKDEIEYVIEDPATILDYEFLIDFVYDYPQYSIKDIFDNYEKFSDLVVEVCKKFI